MAAPPADPPPPTRQLLRMDMNSVRITESDVDTGMTTKQNQWCFSASGDPDFLLSCFNRAVITVGVATVGLTVAYFKYHWATDIIPQSLGSVVYKVKASKKWNSLKSKIATGEVQQELNKIFESIENRAGLVEDARVRELLKSVSNVRVESITLDEVATKGIIQAGSVEKDLATKVRQTELESAKDNFIATEKFNIYFRRQIAEKAKEKLGMLPAKNEAVAPITRLMNGMEVNAWCTKGEDSQYVSSVCKKIQKEMEKIGIKSEEAEELGDIAKIGPTFARAIIFYYVGIFLPGDKTAQEQCKSKLICMRNYAKRHANIRRNLSILLSKPSQDK